MACTHEAVIKDLCVLCGKDLRCADGRVSGSAASVSMVHNVPELKISSARAQALGDAENKYLLSNRKLVLLVDLDQTIVHTTNDNISPDLVDVNHFQLWNGPNLLWYHTKLRPGAREFLASVTKLYQLHICSFGNRQYAHVIAKFLDPEGTHFAYRILSRDECFNQGLKTANMADLFPTGDDLVCIIDDREDVWNYAPNLIHVKPYHFFEGTADINAPPGLEKTAAHNADEVVVKDEVKETTMKPVAEEPAKTEANGDTPPAKKNKVEEASKPAEDSSKSADDDYLIRLEEILVNIHTEFFNRYDKSNETSCPDLKTLMPDMRRGVLSDCRLAFSSLFPSDVPLKQSYPYRIARAMGATVQDLVVTEGPQRTTHLVSARQNTAKTRDAKKNKITIVRPEWLWTCCHEWRKCDPAAFHLPEDATDIPVADPRRRHRLPIAEETAPVVDLLPVYDPDTGDRVKRALPDEAADFSQRRQVPEEDNRPLYNSLVEENHVLEERPPVSSGVVLMTGDPPLVADMAQYSVAYSTDQDVQPLAERVLFSTHVLDEMNDEIDDELAGTSDSEPDPDAGCISATYVRRPRGACSPGGVYVSDEEIDGRISQALKAQARSRRAEREEELEFEVTHEDDEEFGQEELLSDGECG